MTAPEIDALLASLDAIERCCADGDWDAAAARLALHDREVRALQLRNDDVDALRQLFDRQQALQQLITELRDATANELQQFAANKRGAAQYRS